MQSKSFFVAAMLAGWIYTSAAHAEDMTTNAEQQTVNTFKNDTQEEASPIESTKKAESALQQTLDNMPDWSKDLASRIKLHAYAQAGYNYIHNKNARTEDDNSFLMKRVLFWADAKITDRWSFLFMHNFSSVVQEYYTDYRITNNKALTVRFGQFKNAYTYENELSPARVEMIDICSEGVTYLAGCGSDPLYGLQYGRDLGLALFGETNNKKLAYRMNILNGQGINKKDGNAEKDFIGRIDWKPVDGLTLVATGQLGRGHAIATSPYVPEIQVGEDYRRNRWSAGFNYDCPYLHVRGEYLEGKDKDATSRGVYVTGRTPISKTVDFVGSYDFFNYNVDRHMDQHKGVAGIQYWFYKDCRLQLQYVYKSASMTNGAFKHGANHAIMCQMQVMFF